VSNSVKFTYSGGVEVILDFQPNFIIGESKQSLKSSKNLNLMNPRGGDHNYNHHHKTSANTGGCLDCGSLVTIIKDTGIGIPQSMVDRLFRIFGTVNRGQHTSLITTQGIGLGLTICKQLVEKLGGQINLYSVPHIGTEVIFSLPIKCV
jgi:signal transduction histidine kinase